MTIEKKQTAVAVKVLTELTVEASNALWKEARVMMLLNHQNIVNMYGVANDYTVSLWDSEVMCLRDCFSAILSCHGIG